MDVELKSSYFIILFILRGVRAEEFYKQRENNENSYKDSKRGLYKMHTNISQMENVIYIHEQTARQRYKHTQTHTHTLILARKDIYKYIILYILNLRCQIN